jgi:hypothetical protein
LRVDLIGGKKRRGSLEQVEILGHDQLMTERMTIATTSSTVGRANDGKGVSQRSPKEGVR